MNSVKFGPVFFLVGLAVIIGLIASAPDRAPIGAFIVVWLVTNAVALWHNATR